MYGVYRQFVERSTVFLKYFGKLSKNVRECKNPADGGLWWADGGLWWADGGLWWAHEKTPVVAGVCAGVIGTQSPRIAYLLRLPIGQTM
jgi:hypothetical protein